MAVRLSCSPESFPTEMKFRYKLFQSHDEKRGPNDWNDEQREAYRILNAAYNQISILTYDHLLFRAKNVLG